MQAEEHDEVLDAAIEIYEHDGDWFRFSGRTHESTCAQRLLLLSNPAVKKSECVTRVATHS